MKTLINSVWAGIMIAIGSAVYINCSNKIIGAILFSVGLITIMQLKFDLFTGKIGFVRNRRDILYAFIILIGNAIGCLIILFLPVDATEIVINKLAIPLYYVFGRAIICGFIISVCVIIKNSSNNQWYTLLGVPAFILCGAEHSIADICFLISSHKFAPNVIPFIITVVLGNAVGSLLITLNLEYFSRTKKENN